MFRRRIRMPGLWVAALCLLLQLGRVISKEAAPVQKSSAAASSRGSSDRSQIKDAKIVVVVEEDPFTKRTLDEARARVKAALAQSASGESPTINTKAVLSSYQMAAIKGKGKLALSALDELASFHMNGNATLGVARDPRQALAFLNRAAGVHGSPNAQHLMAVAYATGIMGRLEGEEEGGAPNDEVRAIVYDYFGARGGDVHAAMAMGYRYLYGHGTPANCDSSVLYYELAANAAVEELQTLKVLPPNERMRISDTGPGHQPGPKRRGAEADQQLVDYYEHTAEKGDMGAQVALGRLYYHGSQGVEQNFEKAATYFELAAKAGDPTAAGSLGLMYAQGVGVSQSNETALRYFRVGEGNGDGPSLNGLGYMHLYGMGVPQSIDKAAKYFHKAAHEKGNSDAFYNLGLIYAGIVTQPEDPNRPAQPATQPQLPQQQPQLAKQPEAGWGGSKANGEPRAMVHEGTPGSKMRLSGGSPSGTTGPPQHGAPLTGQNVVLGGDKSEGIRKNMQKALKYFSLSAQAGHMAALHKIGQMYAQGISTGKACSTAVHAFKGVAERGSWVKQLARAYNEYKKGDMDGALIDYIYLAELGYEVAQWNAGLLLESHVCLHLTPLACQRLSFRYFTHASKQGNADASLKVGDAWYYGKAGLVVDYERAAKYYQAAAELRQPQAMFNLGFMHQHGIGLKQDFHLSKRYYDASAESHPDSRWPVNLALLGLYLQWWYQRDAHDHIITTGPASPFASIHRQPQNAAANGWEAEVERISVLVEEYRERLSGDLLPATDTLLIIALTSLLMVVMRRRMQREQRRRRESQRAGEEGNEATLGQGEGAQPRDGHIHQD